MKTSGTSGTRTPLALAVLLCTPLLLTACGGGGGGDDSAAVPTPQQPATTVAAVAITTDNAKPVAADAIGATTGAGAAQTGTSLVTGVQVNEGAAALASDANAWSQRALRLLARAGSPAALATGVTTNQTVACSLGGTLTVSGTVASSAALSAGDTVTLTASNCSENTGTAVGVMSGSMTLTVQGGSFNPNSLVFPQHVVLVITMRSFSVQSLGVTDTADGDMTLDVTATSATASTGTTSGNALSTSRSGPGGSHSTTLKQYRIAQSSQGTVTTSNITATIESTNTRLAAAAVSYQLSTPEALVTDGALILRGSMKVVGRNSGLLLTTTSINNFTLQVDANGDGAYESSTTTTTADLQALI